MALKLSDLLIILLWHTATLLLLDLGRLSFPAMEMTLGLSVPLTHGGGKYHGVECCCHTALSITRESMPGADIIPKHFKVESLLCTRIIYLFHLYC